MSAPKAGVPAGLGAERELGPLGIPLQPGVKAHFLLPTAKGLASGPSEQLLFLGPLEGDLLGPALCSTKATVCSRPAQPR